MLTDHPGSEYECPTGQAVGGTTVHMPRALLTRSPTKLFGNSSLIAHPRLFSRRRHAGQIRSSIIRSKVVRGK